MNAYPQPGDRILILREPYLSLILNGTKDLELRALQYTPGRYWVGRNQLIYGQVSLGPPFRINSDRQLQDLFSRHQFPGQRLPYRRTFAFPIVDYRVVHPPIPYEHPRGAVGIVKYRPV